MNASLNKLTLSCLLIAAALAMTACGKKQEISAVEDGHDPRFYAKIAREVVATFEAKYRTSYKSLEEVAKLTEDDKKAFQTYEVREVLAYLFGPLTTRELGGPKRDETVTVLWDKAELNKEGQVEITYTYSGTWILTKELPTVFELPLPYETETVYSPEWKRCTDSEPEHQTSSFYWYFWDPTRRGCDHVQGKQYQTIQVSTGVETKMTKETFPEYKELIRSAGKDNNLQMTFAFGYATDKAEPNPQKDSDVGMREYQKFLKVVRDLKRELKLKETPILQSEYKGAVRPEAQVGVRFNGTKDGVAVTINVVAAAEIDQMELFAKSFAHDHDGFFGWFGHSRVGSGFDADNFGRMVKRSPDYYSITKQHQMIYWAGCNSYSYYSLPFFKFKAGLDPVNDPLGTKALDILGNGLPSLFIFNAYNAEVALTAVLNWKEPTSYQKIVDTLENYASRWGQVVLVNILGDEDNSPQK